MKILKIAFVFFTFIMFCSLTSYAQNVLKGTIQDAQTMEPVAGANVRIPGTATAALTDAKGQFQLNYTSDFDSIYIDGPGYVHQAVAVADKSKDINIYMVPAAEIYMRTVEITDIRQNQSVTNVSDADLHRYSGLNLQDALNNVPGVNMQSRTPWGGQHIIIRGYYPSADNGRTNAENFNGLGYRLSINNIPVTDATGLSIMDDIDFSTLGNVEIIKGPSPLYGSYIGGAVNLFTPKPAPNEHSLSEQFIAGSYGLLRSNTTLQTSDGKTDVWLNYGHQSYSGFRPHDSSMKDYLSFAANFNVNEKQTLSTYFSYSHSNEQLAGEIDSADLYARNAVSNPLYVGNNSHSDIESFRSGVTDKYRFNRHFSNQTTLFATGSTLNSSFAHGFNKNQSMGYGARTAFNYVGRAGKVGIDGTLGAFYQRSNMNAQGNFIPPFVPQPFTPSSPNNTGSDVQNKAATSNIFTQWTFSLPSQFSVALGGSMNFVNFSTQNLVNGAKAAVNPNLIYLNTPVYSQAFSPVFTPSLSLTKTFSRSISAYASASMGYAPPTIAQMLTSAGRVDSSLKPESAMQYEIGARGTLAHKFSYQLAVFDMEITNKLTQEAANSVTYYTNVGEQQNMGAELYLNYAAVNNKDAIISLVRPWISYTYSNFTYKDFKNHVKSKKGEDSIAADYSGNQVAGIAPNMFNIGLDVASKYGFYLNGTFRYMDKVAVTFDNRQSMNSYTLLSAKLGYRRDLGKHFALDVYAGGDNLLSSTYYSFIFLGQNIQELGRADDTFIQKGGGDGYILPAPYKATFYGGFSLKYKF
jgi:iron complex outermembrane receptor protein